MRWLILFVGCRAVANFSVTFSIISIITGVTTLFNSGLTYGGPITMVYGWPVVGLLTLPVGLSMAEICSAYPTSAGLYFWSAKLSGHRWGPLAAWLTGWYVKFKPPSFVITWHFTWSTCAFILYIYLILYKMMIYHQYVIRLIYVGQPYIYIYIY